MTDEQFRALGELSVYFAILDEEITIALCRVITCRDTTLATKTLATMNFRGKLDAIRTALDCMDIESETARSAVEDFRDLIGEVQGLSDARNRLMHFHVEFGKSGEDNAPAGEILVHPKTRVHIDASAKRIGELAKDCLGKALVVTLGADDVLRAVYGEEE